MSNRKFSLVAKIKALLNLGDEGKLESFFTIIERESNNRIKQLQQNIKKAELDHELQLSEFNDKIADAELESTDAYTDVDMDMLETKTSQKEYMEIYLNNIRRKENALNDLIERKKRLEENHKERIDSYNNDIAKIESRLEKILVETEEA